MTAEQLRNSILQEAISGRLVPQDPNDEPASVLLQRIREEKARLVKEGKLKKKDLVETPITEDEIPFEIPSSWGWIKLKDLFHFLQGIQVDKEKQSEIQKDDQVRFLRIIDYTQGNEPPRYIDDPGERYHIKSKDLVMIRYGSPGLPCRGYDGVLANNLFRIIPYSESVLDREYTYRFFTSPYFQSFCNAYGVALSAIKFSTINEVLFPFPPLAEQKRIVAKLEELLPIVEQYGKAKKELDELNAALPARLRQSILQEAIHGKLVPQDEKEGTAEELLKLIDAEKQRLVKERILKKAIRTSAIIPEDSPFEIPTSWLWANLEDVTYAVGGRENQILSKEILKEGKIRVVSQGQAIYDGYCNDATKEINDLPVILFGDHTRNVKYIDFTFVIGADGTKLFRPIGIYPRYMYYWMKYAASTLRNRGYARHYTLLKVVPVPLPPLAEQERIVAKIEELFAEIDKMK